MKIEIWAVAIDSDNGLLLELFESEREAEDYVLESFGASRAELEASGEDFADFLEPIVEQTIDSWTMESKMIEVSQ